jgi:hypothetical protein
MRHPLDQLVLGVDGQLEQLLVELSWEVQGVEAPNRTGRGAWTAGTGSRSRRRAWTMDTQNPSQHRSAAALLV